MAATIHEILADAGIDFRRLRLVPGEFSYGVCPVCDGGRSKAKCLTVRVDDDGRGVTWKCHRGTCPTQFKGGGRVHSDQVQSQPKAKVYDAPKVYADPQKPQKMYDWFLKRGITSSTVDCFGIFMASVYFPQVQGEKCAIAFPYRWRGEVTGHKYRSSEKEFAQDKNTKPTLFGIDELAATHRKLGVVVEGEMDVIAMREAGFYAVSLRDGAPQKAGGNDKRFAAVDMHAEELSKVERWVIATDADEPGRIVASEWVKRLGPKKCWRVTWPVGLKDANDVLKQFIEPNLPATGAQIEAGRKALQEAVEGAVPYPMAGLFRPSPERALAHRERGRVVRGLECGIGALDEAMKLPREGGRLIVVTGYPNMGKSPMTRQLMVRLAAFHGIKAAFAAPEEGSADVMVEYLTQLRAEAPFWDGPTPRMTRDDLVKAAEWAGKHFAIIESDDPDEPLTIEYVLEMAEAAKLRMGLDYLVFDPWNEFEMLCKQGESETLMTSRVLKHLKAWGRANGVDIVLVVHPAKPSADDRRSPRPPTGYDCAGSANFNNKADLGLTVWRPADTDTSELIVWKSKSPVWSSKGNKAVLKYDIATGRYRSADPMTRDYMPPEDDF